MNRRIFALLGLAFIALSTKAADITFPVERPTLAAGNTLTLQFQKDDPANKNTGWNQTVTITGRGENGYSIVVDPSAGVTTVP